MPSARELYSLISVLIQSKIMSSQREMRMHTHRGLAGSAVALTVLALLASSSSVLAQRPARERALPLERSLLGVSLLADHREVLRRFGQPSEIQVGSPALPAKFSVGGATASASGSAAMSGGGASALMPPGMGARGPGGVPGMGMPPGMGGGTSPMGGMMGARGPGGMPMSGAAMAGMMSGMMGGRGPGGLPGFSPRGGDEDDSRGGPPGMGGGMAGMMGGGAGSTNAESPDEQEATWWYHIEIKDKQGNVRQRRHYSFLFNKEGRVIQIQQYGYNGGGKTARGIGLGSQLRDVIRLYEWSNDGGRNGETLLLRYDVGEKPSALRQALGLTPDGPETTSDIGEMPVPKTPSRPNQLKRAKLAFQVVRNQVVGITLAVVTDTPAPAPINP
jgi:hypothetical protein